MKKRNVKMIYQYDGSKFFGFQRQVNEKTVQGEIEKVLKMVFSQEVNMISSGRTDKGVHALGQVSNFFIDENIPLEAVERQINKALYGEVKVLAIEEVDENFNSRYDAKSRKYVYVMKSERVITPFETHCVTKIKDDVKTDKLQEIMEIFVGKHDFSSFMKKDKVKKNPVREIFSVKCFKEEGDRIIIEICGSSFLKTMVRIMIGSSLAVYFGKKDRNYIEEKLKNPDVDGQKILAPSEGLYLAEVYY